MKSISDINLQKLINKREYYPSPESWAEQILYFLMVDRFASKDEYPLYDPEKDYENAVQTKADREEWDKSGEKWNGGNLKGLINKLDYLQELGITGIWVSPVLKQPPFSENYHGYGSQNFLALDSHFGTQKDLKKLTEEAHIRGMFILLDVILNHSGDVFEYQKEAPAYDGNVHSVEGFRDKEGQPTIDPEKPDCDRAWPEGGVWPRELFKLDTFSRKGYIENWDSYPEYIEGDFFSLKNINTGEGDYENYKPSSALEVLTECYKYWIAYADLDGFRLDTVKHLSPGATRFFTTEIHEFAYSLGKKNFYIVGEITGGIEFAQELLDKTGLNAALGINKIPQTMEDVVKGQQPAENYFSIFRNSRLQDDQKYTWYNSNVITMLDDHDMVYKQEHKERFCAQKEAAPLVTNAVFLDLFSLGIPCLYYGTEQCFDGSGDRDKYVREAMFGGKFGAFRTSRKSFFNENHPVYREISKLTKLRKEHLPLQTGRQYLREISPRPGTADFQYPRPENEENRYTGIIGWSRIFSKEEFLLAVNCSCEKTKTTHIMVDSNLHDPGQIFKCIYSSAQEQIGDSAEVQKLNKEHYYLKIPVPARGQVVYRPG